MGSDTDWRKRRRRSVLGEGVDTDPDAARQVPPGPNKLERTVPGTKRSTTVPLGPPPRRR